MESANTDKIKQEALNYIKTNNLIGIRAGEERTTFLNIWMVVVQERIFARLWGLAEKSWFSTFLRTSSGAIQCGEQIFPVQGHIPDDLPELEKLLNQAYLEKYDSGSNSFYAQGIIQPQQVGRTMDLVLC